MRLGSALGEAVTWSRCPWRLLGGQDSVSGLLCRLNSAGLNRVLAEAEQLAGGG